MRKVKGIISLTAIVGCLIVLAGCGSDSDAVAPGNFKIMAPAENQIVVTNTPKFQWGYDLGAGQYVMALYYLGEADAATAVYQAAVTVADGGQGIFTLNDALPADLDLSTIVNGGVSGYYMWAVFSQSAAQVAAVGTISTANATCRLNNPITTAAPAAVTPSAGNTLDDCYRGVVGWNIFYKQ